MKLALSLMLLSSVSAFQVAPHRASTVTTTALDASRRDMLSSAAATVVGGLVIAAQPALAREVYLTEPTDEFKVNEAKAMEFKRAQLTIKADFNKVLERFTTVSKTEEQIVGDLEELKYLVIKTGGLPLGIKKEELFKIIRRKKASELWTVPTEYAYQALVREIAYQQSPNTEKDEANPL